MSLAVEQADQHTVPCWINGKALPLDSKRLFPVISSITGDTLHHAQNADRETALAAVDAAWGAFQTWKRTSIPTRRNLLLKLADIYEQRQEELVRFQQEETSCDGMWAKNNVTTSVGYLRETAACLSSINGEIPQIEKPDTMGFVFKDPVGPILTIPPWNAAIVLCTRAVATAIGAGCTVVLKASELCPRTHYAIVQALTEAGIPPGVLNQIQCRREDAASITEALIADPRIRKVEFIGSASVGKIIGSVAAKYLKPVLMELGGKCPAIVLDDADLERAARLCGTGAFLHHGQICFSTERIIVLRSVAEAFKSHLAVFVTNFQTPGAAATTAFAKHAEDILTDATTTHGASFLVGSISYTGPTTLTPAIVLNPSTDARIADEETFGPSASLYVVENDEEAIGLANRSAYGLNATIHSRDMERAIKMARELEYGQVHINSTSVYTASTGPQGGVKGSGWGRQNAKWGLEEFYVNKFVTFSGAGAP